MSYRHTYNNELSKYFRADPPVECVVEDRAGGRKYSCSLEEFRDMSYEDLVALKTAYLRTDYYRNKQQLAAGGVK
jgi:hypothetical protein